MMPQAMSRLFVQRQLTPFAMAMAMTMAITIIIVEQIDRIDAIEDTVTLKCDEFERHYESAEVFCTVSGFIVSHNQNVKIPKYPKANMTKFMKFYDSQLLYVPYKLFDVFVNLKTLDVSFTEIMDVPRNTFGAASNLSFLNMSNNNISDITTSVFVGATNLMRLDLSRNNITKITEHAFLGLPNLDKIQLSFNKLTEINRDIFAENPYIEIIALDNNQIEFIEPEVFNRLRRVRDVNLCSNRLKYLDPAAFQAAYSLETLLLSGNQLIDFYLANKSIILTLHLNANSLTRLSINGTKAVRADHNRIETIEMVNAVFLETLELNSNNISDISNITNVTGLLQLDLSNNPIGELKINTFNRLKRLRSLSLRSTGLRQLNFGIFSKQTSLESLDLAYNNLTSLNLDIFVPYLSNLKDFYIDGNNLTEIQGKRSISMSFPHLVSLGLSRNRFNCSYLHSLLVPPNLSPAVALHIERDDSDIETSHIRDVSCISETLRHTQKDLREMTELQKMMSQSIVRLEIYLLLLKIALLSIVCLLVVMIVLRLWRVRRASYFARRSGSIVFHSTATVNNNLEH